VFAFDGNKRHTIPSDSGPAIADDAGLGCFTLTLALHPTEPPNRFYRTILYKGNGNQDRTPSLWFVPHRNQVTYRVTTNQSAPKETWGTSTAEVALRRWTHLAFASCATGDGHAVMKLYLNGALDSAVKLLSPAILNAGDWHIGKDLSNLGMHGYVANLRVYNRLLEDSEVAGDQLATMRGLPALSAFPSATVWPDQLGPREDPAPQLLFGTLDKTYAARDLYPEPQPPACKHLDRLDAAKASYDDGLASFQAGLRAPTPGERWEALRRAAQNLTDAASLGHAEANWHAALVKSSGLGGVEAPEAAALTHLLEGARRGNIESLLALGWRSGQGFGVSQGCEAALFYTKQAAGQAYAVYNKPGQQVTVDAVELTDSVAQNREDHKGEDSDLNQYLIDASRHGNGDAQVQMGIRYYWGSHGVAQNHPEALRYFQEAHRNGRVAGTVGSAKMLLKGEGGPMDVNASLQLFEQGVDMGSAEALNGLGYLYHSGKHVERNFTKAFDYFSRAAELGSADGLVNSGLMTQAGRGTEKNAEKAYDYFLRGARKGHIGSAYHAAFAEMGGQGTARSCRKAVKHFRLVAETGKWAESLKDGLKAYLAKRHVDAVYHYSAAAEKGYRMGVYNLAWLLDRHRTKANALLPSVEGGGELAEEMAGLQRRAPGLYRRLMEDESWLEKQSWARLKLANCNYFGESHGCVEDSQAAYRLYQEGVEYGDVQSHYSLAGILLMGGELTPANLTTAEALFRDAHKLSKVPIFSGAALAVFLAFKAAYELPAYYYGQKATAWAGLAGPWNDPEALFVLLATIGIAVCVALVLLRR